MCCVDWRAAVGNVVLEFRDAMADDGATVFERLFVVRLLGEAAANRSPAIFEPVSGSRKRKLEKNEQRPAPKILELPIFGESQSRPKVQIHLASFLRSLTCTAYGGRTQSDGQILISWTSPVPVPSAVQADLSNNDRWTQCLIGA
jgi:hypothetical protein